MQRMIKYGSIDQFRQIVKAMQYHGNPTITVQLTEKIHGTNASVCFSEKTGLWVQSKNNIITPESDNAGCAAFVMAREQEFLILIHQIAHAHNIDLHNEILTLYFEWCGGNIQKNSCVSGLDKRAILFSHFKVSGMTEEVSDDGRVTNEYWMPLTSTDYNSVLATEAGIYHVSDFYEVELQIDFERPAVAQNQLVEIAEGIENNSRIAGAFGKPDNIGEGVVGVFFHQEQFYRFKVKCEKHSKTKVKKLAKVDEVKEGKIVDFVNNHACPAWRLEQAWQEVFGIENEKLEPTVKATGDFLRAVHKDVQKEETDVLEDMGLTWQEVNSKLSKVAREWFMEQLDKEAGLV